MLRDIVRRIVERFWARQTELAERDRLFREGCERAANREEWQHPMNVTGYRNVYHSHRKDA